MEGRMKIKNITPKELKEWRGPRTQQQAADALSIPYETYRRLESGERKIKSWVRTAMKGAAA
jgi:hypothetical protein